MFDEGYQIGSYRIISAIGAGGMGEVFLAEDTRLDRNVAIKFLNKEFSRDEDKLNRFIQEAKAVSALNHPNILTVYEIGKTGEFDYIVTEFIKGKTLRAYLLSGESISLSTILKFTIQVAEALSTAHQSGIIHRDIKPENIMIREDGYVKVLDFGLAKLTEKAKWENVSTEDKTKVFVKTNPGMVMGTVSYMSPEQSSGRETDVRTDIWSLGVVIYEMLSGKVPFMGETISHTIVSILEKEPPHLERIPDELQRIINKTLSKKVETRYQTARDLLIDLKNFRRILDIQGELEYSHIPNRDAATAQIQENSTQIFTKKFLEEKQPVIEARTTPNATTTSSLEYAVTQAQSHKLATATIGIILLGIISIIVYLGFFAKTGAKSIESIAVMPFVNQGGNADIEYLSDGMTETLIGSLSQIPHLNIKARSSVFRFKGKEMDAKTLGSELNVQAILTGRVLQRGDQLTLNLELVDVDTENVIWSESYNRKQSDLISLQNEIVRDVSNKLRARLSGDEQAKVNKTSTTNPQAYELYLKGRFYWNKRTEADIKHSIEFFNQAIEKDPAYAMAYSGLADAYQRLPNYAADRNPEENYPKARSAAQKALEIDPTLAEPHAALAAVLFYFDWNFAEAEKEFKHAIEIDPNYASAHQWYAEYLGDMGRYEEAIAEAKLAQQLDPLSLIINSVLGLTYHKAGRYDEAITQYRKTLEIDPDFLRASEWLEDTYLAKGMYEEAIETDRKIQLQQGTPPEQVENSSALLKEAYRQSGERGYWQKSSELAQEYYRTKKTEMPPVDIARFNIKLGNKEQALEQLEKAFDSGKRDPYFCSLKWASDWNPLHQDPRFQELLRKIGFPK